MLIVYLILYAQKAQDNYASISYSLALYLMDCRLNLGYPLVFRSGIKAYYPFEASFLSKPKENGKLVACVLSCAWICRVLYSRLVRDLISSSEYVS